MIAGEALKTYLHKAIDAEVSEEILQEIWQVLERKYPLVSEQLEAEIALAMADVEAGNVVSLDTFLAESAKEREELVRKYA